MLLIGRAKFRISLRLEQKLPVGGPLAEALDGGRALLGPFARVEVASLRVVSLFFSGPKKTSLRWSDLQAIAGLVSFSMSPWGILDPQYELRDPVA